MSRRLRERGSASIFVLGMSLVLMVCAGLVVDGGLAINARMRIADDAEQAARAGADAINIEALRDEQGITINPAEASQRASDYLRGRGYADNEFTVLPELDRVVVTINDKTETSLLKLINIDDFPINARAVSTPETEADP